MIFMIILNSSLFMLLNHPMSMGLILLIQTILISLITGFMFMNYWFSYILFLIMIGGMLILFIYMTSIASNEKFKFSNKILMMMMSILIMYSLSFMMLDNFLPYYSSFSSSMMNSFNFKLNLSKFFNMPSIIIMFTMIIYLFITLIAVVKISNINMGPLRQKI
uniref:NADH-ubiquinone oxidoreductase chain 6 n=1 Tax=Staphylinoidea sp. 12 KM-2017 TaxID=2219452 RepID=A0A346RFJ4_9COLE|nr:NADH dehydrogenase subunit 6 [Staphylinoidea sp. 12 KM-2017]